MPRAGEQISVRLHFKYDGGSASNGELEVYDAALALRGISRALAITTHAVTTGEVSVRAERAKGARFLVHPPTRGSYDQLVTILLDPTNLGSVIGISVVSNAIWDLIKVSWSGAAGILAEPETPAGRRLVDRIEPIMGDLEAVLEPAVRDMHRPIASDPEVSMQVVRPRVGTILTFDEETLEYVSAITESPEVVLVLGNVTRYNAITGFGRLFDDAADRTVPFQIVGGFDRAQRELLTWSIDQFNRGNAGKLFFEAKKVQNVRDQTLRYIVLSVRKQPQTPHI